MESSSYELYLDDIDITSEKIDFDGIDEDLAAFQEDEMVKLALQRGVELNKYARDLEKELKNVRRLAHFQHRFFYYYKIY